MYWLFNTLGVDLMVDVFFWLLEEQKVVVLSEDLGLLGQCIATMSGLLYPLTWVSHQISPLPTSLVESMQGPGALFHGMVRSGYLGMPKKKELLCGIVVVDLDERAVVQGPAETYMEPPAEDRAALRERLAEAYRLFSGVGELGWSAGAVPDAAGAGALQGRVRGVFLSYFAELLRGYRSYLLPLRVYPRSALLFRFIDDAFVRGVEGGEKRREYVEQLIRNQMFQYFIENRPWPVGDAFDVAVAGEIWKVPVADLDAFMDELSGVVNGPATVAAAAVASSPKPAMPGALPAVPPPPTSPTQGALPFPAGKKKEEEEAEKKKEKEKEERRRRRFGLERAVYREIRSVPQTRVSRAYVQRALGTIQAAVPDFSRIRADGVAALKEQLGEAYFRLLVCEAFFQGIERSVSSNPWDVPVGAWEALSDLFSAVVARAYEASDYLTLRYATEIIKECHAYKNGNHSLYERCLNDEAVAAVYRTPAVWERMFAYSMAEIYRAKYCCSNNNNTNSSNNNNGGSEEYSNSNSNSNNIIGEKMYDIPAERQRAYEEDEWALARAEFVYFAQMMEAFGEGETVHRIISGVIVNFDFGKCNGLIEELKPQVAYSKANTVQKASALPYELEDVQTLLLWVDDKVTEANVAAVRSSVTKCLPGGLATSFEILHFTSAEPLQTWLAKYAHLVPERIKVATNYYRAFDGGDKAAQKVIDLVRKTFGLPDVPVIIFCGPSGIVAAEALAAANKNCRATTKNDDLVTFCVPGAIKESSSSFFGI